MRTVMPPSEVRAIRTRLGLSQAAFATVLGVIENTVWRWEAGRRAVDHITTGHIRRTAAEYMAIADQRRSPTSG